MPPSLLEHSANFNKKILMVIIIAIIAVGGAFYLGQLNGNKAGYAQAQADIQTFQEESAQKAANDAAKSANPFQAVNPLEGVEANPFEKVKKVLNPFEN